jgi:hypothetical protein
MDTCAHCLRAIHVSPVKTPNGLMHDQCAKSVEAITGRTADRSLVLQLLVNSTPDLAESLGKLMSDCAAVCFDSQGHITGRDMAVLGKLKGRCKVFWHPVSPTMARSFQMDTFVTEWGACGVAILLTQSLTKYKVIEQSVRGTGFDFWLGHKGKLPFDRKARLEVSGLRPGNDAEVKERRDKKIDQTKQSDNTKLRAYIVIVEFGRPLSHVSIRSISRKGASSQRKLASR